MKISILAASAAVVLLAAGGVAAQSTTETTNPSGYAGGATPVEEDEGMDFGWLGLLGLAGLMGLRKRPETVRTHADTGTSGLNR